MSELGINWEAVGVFLTLALATLGAIVWLIKIVWGWRASVLTSSREKMVKSILESEYGERVKTLELDLKNAAQHNMMMSQAFHAEINKILHLLTGRES